MNPWIIILLIAAAVVYGIDYLLRRKKWKENTKEELSALLVNMFSVGPFAFLSVLGILWGIASSTPETPFGEAVYDVTLKLGSYIFVVAALAIVLSMLLRKWGKNKASILLNVGALAYTVLVLGINALAGKLL